MEWDEQRWQEVVKCCKNCENRNETCHSYCTEYKDFVVLNEIKNKIIKDKKDKEYASKSYTDRIKVRNKNGRKYSIKGMP